MFKTRCRSADKKRHFVRPFMHNSNKTEHVKAPIKKSSLGVMLRGSFWKKPRVTGSHRSPKNTQVPTRGAFDTTCSFHYL
jgi:hypothetical protein